jgi:hypothetical protein
VRRALHLWALVLCVACPTPPKPPAPPPAPGAATCADVCAHLTELGCDAARPTAKGATCLDVCRNVQASGIVSWDLDCRLRSPSCGEADSCEASR